MPTHGPKSCRLQYSAIHAWKSKFPGGIIVLDEKEDKGLLMLRDVD